MSVFYVGAPTIHETILGHIFSPVNANPHSVKLLRVLLLFSITLLFLSLLLFWSLAVVLRLEDSDPSPGVSETPEWVDGYLPTGEEVPQVWSPGILQDLTAEGRSVEAPGQGKVLFLEA